MSDETKPKVQIWAQGQPITVPDLRDRFAMAALTGVVAQIERGRGESAIDAACVRAAYLAYEIADAAMKAREAK